MMIGRSLRMPPIQSPMPETLSQPDAGPRAARVRRRLLAWYDVHQRRLPWRTRPDETPNPYHVLVSEAMLQQTQVATVIDYFARFIHELPTVHDLADAKVVATTGTP